MGIDLFTARFLKNEQGKGTSFDQTLTLGQQTLYMHDAEYASIMSALGRAVTRPPRSEDLFRALGATAVVAMDASEYEGAGLIHDLNQPVSEDLHRRFECVFDGGTLEHVFNFPTALKNCMQMVKVGGHFLGVAPGNNYCGHGFYQFSPELFFNALSPANGYVIERVLFVYRDRWYAAQNPGEAKERVSLVTDEPTQFYISARRIEERTIFDRWPQQSDYVQSWGDDNVPAPASTKGSAKEALLGASPALRRLQTRWRAFKHRREFSPENRARFTPVDID